MKMKRSHDWLRGCLPGLYPTEGVVVLGSTFNTEKERLSDNIIVVIIEVQIAVIKDIATKKHFQEEI